MIFNILCEFWFRQSIFSTIKSYFIQDSIFQVPIHVRFKVVGVLNIFVNRPIQLVLFLKSSKEHLKITFIVL